jgi:hypothetical protein
VGETLLRVLSVNEAGKNMRRSWKNIFIFLVGIAAVIQFARPSRTNPPVDPSREITTFHPATPVVSSALERSCNDCHSNRTAWPWYSDVAPASWLVAHDVSDGRSTLNFSEWGSYSLETRQKLLGEICESVKEREMPMPQYTLIHRNARLSASDIQALCSWTREITQGAPGLRSSNSF